jgi:ATP synthase protein I
MPSLTACPSPQGEKPEGIQEQELSAASRTETEPSGLPAAARLETGDSSEAPSGVAEPTATAVGVSPLQSPAEAEGPTGSTEQHSDGMEHFQRLRRRLLVSTLVASLTAVPVCWLLFDRPAALSLLVGAVAGLLYLVLLARSVARLGGDRRSVGKIQLLVPVVLVLASARIPALELVPALVGFLLYKPALLVQAYLDR